MATQAVGYRRVSTADQGLGLDAQTVAIEAAAIRLGLPLGQTFTDAGLSGGLPLDKRPALMDALGALRRGDVMIVAKRDRLGRDLLNVAMIERLVERKGGRIVSGAGEGTDDDGPSGVLMRQICDSFSQYERALIGVRTKAALKAKRAKGERAGNVPYGFRLADDDDQRQRLEHDPDERRVLGLVHQLRADGLTLRAVADRLNVAGITTRRGTPWRHQYVAGLVGLRVGGAAKVATSTTTSDRIAA
jgi:DNA invertase Pin-like site-specific DNA recombinase